ncbi:hypothetical protein KIL84_000304 [Mauremys mutica]|uniref:Uncharacterized protein n=1 Tax=Mauremys mutica TaxID=74926 RepID=A0A9D3XGL9_9SAUR|nr:hypothetical protein KIL84_000304 [Mauremys mutica]
MGIGTSDGGSAATPTRHYPTSCVAASPIPEPGSCNTTPSMIAWPEPSRHPCGKVAMNSTIPRTVSQLQPDIVITNEDRKKIIMVAVTVPFENRTPAFHDARA